MVIRKKLLAPSLAALLMRTVASLKRAVPVHAQVQHGSKSSQIMDSPLHVNRACQQGPSPLQILAPCISQVMRKGAGAYFFPVNMSVIPGHRKSELGSISLLVDIGQTTNHCVTESSHHRDRNKAPAFSETDVCLFMDIYLLQLTERGKAG